MTKYVVVMVANIAKDVVADGGVDVDADADAGFLVDTDCDVLIIYNNYVLYFLFLSFNRLLWKYIMNLV